MAWTVVSAVRRRSSGEREKGGCHWSEDGQSQGRVARQEGTRLTTKPHLAAHAKTRFKHLADFLVAEKDGTCASSAVAVDDDADDTEHLKKDNLVALRVARLELARCHGRRDFGECADEILR